MTKLNIDVMTQGGEKFYCSLVYMFNPLFKLNIDDVIRFVYSKRPTLKYRKDVVLVLENNFIKKGE